MRLVSARIFRVTLARPNLTRQLAVFQQCRLQSSSAQDNGQEPTTQPSEAAPIISQASASATSASASADKRNNVPIEVLSDRNDRAVSRRFATFLDRLVPSTVDGEMGRDRSSAPFHPNESFLAFFPPSEQGPGGVAADGGIQGHVPRGVRLAQDWEEWDAQSPSLSEKQQQGGGPGSWKRLWKGGEVNFMASVPMVRGDGSAGKLNSWRCLERVHFPEGIVAAGPAGGDVADPKTPWRDPGTAADVDVERIYKALRGKGHLKPKRCIIEVRRLAFVSGRVDVDPAVRVIKARATPTDTYEFRPSPADLVEFSRLTHNAHFIHLDNHDDGLNLATTSSRSLVQGSMLLAVMIRAAEHAALSESLRAPASGKPQEEEHGSSSDSGRRLTGGVATRVVKTISYTILRPSLVGRRLRVCVRRPPPVTEGTVTPPLSISTWPVWVEDVETGGMVVRASVEMRPSLVSGWAGEDEYKEADEGSTDKEGTQDLEQETPRRKNKKRADKKRRVAARNMHEADETTDVDASLLPNDWEKHTI